MKIIHGQGLDINFLIINGGHIALGSIIGKLNGSKKLLFAIS
jgi:hypothetical protein